jgi:hypothetical protein
MRNLLPEQVTGRRWMFRVATVALILLVAPLPPAARL